MELHRAADEEESYFVSMTDLMVGTLFIFIILLMHFALQLRDKREEIQNVERSANQVRTDILNELKAELEKAGVQVEIDLENGILRLPENVLFASGKPELSDQGRISVSKLALALDKALRCHAISARWDLSSCNRDDHKIETIFIEGHTDGDPIRGNDFGNWELSTARATNTFRQLTIAVPDLNDLKNEVGQSVFSVSGYADARPLPSAPIALNLPMQDVPIAAPRTEKDARTILSQLSTFGLSPELEKEQRERLMLYLGDAKAGNRRIDIRIIMKRRGLDELQEALDLTVRE